MEQREFYPIDKWDQLSAEMEAEHIAWPETLSDKAKETLRYFDADTEYSTIFLFRYKERLVITDESQWLTTWGNGTAAAPFGCPRAELKTMQEVEAWLELVHDDLVEDGYDFEKMEYEDGGLPLEVADA